MRAAHVPGLVATGAVWLAVGVGSAEGSFPGRNGVIAFDLLRTSGGGEGEDVGTDRRILLINPRTGQLVQSELCSGPLFECQDSVPAFWRS